MARGSIAGCTGSCGIYGSTKDARHRAACRHCRRGAGAAAGGRGAQEAAVELSHVDRAMQRLPADQREAVLLVMVEGYAYKEAAEIVGCPVAHLNLRRARGDAHGAMLERYR